MPPKTVTSVDVAHRAGVSQSTVSRVFSAEDRVSGETRARVLAAAQELGYQPNVLARSLTTQQSNIVGIVTHISNPFYPYVIEKLTRRLQEMGRQTLLFSVEPDQDVDEILPLVLQYRVDALIITSASLSSEMASQCERQGTPVVLFNRYVLGAKVSAVCCDNIEGGRLVANLLLDAGHKRLAHIAGRAPTSTNRDREKGFADRLRERGYANWLRDESGHDYQTGREAAARLLGRPDRPDAIFCVSDIVAFGAIDAARYDCGLRVPDDVSIIGFDDLPAAAWPAYSVTTIREPVNRMVELTLKHLVERIHNPEAEPVLELLPGQLVQRASARLAL
ncbi:MAG: LacI family DNA-binding transcriptional regulator [Anaerolineales bacterium]|nr:LacI family DNA-binding transcriptional regulator [Anaerolineales bacterium]